MIVTATIGGELMPLLQVTVRKEAEKTSLELQIVGSNTVSIGASCVLAASGFSPISALITACTPGPRVTSMSAESATVIGTSEFLPEKILYRNDSGFRAPVDFNVSPGDAWMGVTITSTTTTIGTGSPGFTEIRING